MPGQWDRNMVDVRERWQFVHQCIAGKERRLPQDRQVGPRPPAYYEIPVFVRVASPLATHIEVEHRAGLPSRLAEVATAARASLLRSEYPAVGRVNSGRPNRVMEQKFSQVALLLSCL